MVQEDSLLGQARHSEQLSLQQMQLAELQKIANQLASSGGIAGNATSSVGGQYVGGVGSMPTNMTATPYDPGTQTQGVDMMAQAAAVGGMALSAGVKGINQTASVGRAALDRTTGYIDRMQQSPFFAYKSIDWTRTNMEQAESIQMQSRHRLENAGLKIGSALGNMGMASVGGAVGTAVGGPIGAVVGTVGGSILGSIGGDQIIKHVGVQQGYEKWLQQNSGRMINMFESNDGFGDGFDMKEGKKLSKTLSKMNTKFFMSNDELFTMLNGVTDAGLMKSASDMEDFQKKFSGLVESIKGGAKMLNLSYEEMTNLYGEWNKMGIKTDGERGMMGASSKTLSMITGMDEGKAAQALSQLIKQTVAGTTLDATTGSQIAQTDLSMASTVRERGLVSDASLRVIENDYGSNDQAVAAAMGATLKSGYGNEQIKAAVAAAMTQGSDGSVRVDQGKLDELMTKMDKQEMSLQDVARLGGQNLTNGTFSRDFVHRYSSMTGDQMYQYMMEGVGVTGANGFINKLINSEASRNGLSAEQMMVDMGIANSHNQALLFNDYTGVVSQYGDAMGKDISRQNAANLIRNEASSQLGLSLTARVKNGWESIWQGAASLMPSLDGFTDSWKDFTTDMDSAMRNGYSDAAKKNIASNQYKDVFKDIEKTSDKLDKEFKMDIKGDLNSKVSKTRGIMGIGENVLDIIMSPSRWDTGFQKFLSGDLGDIVNTNLSHEGDSIKNLRKKTNRSKTMSDKEKKAMIDNINQASGQTQDMVSGALDVVTALGGRGAREDMLDSITIDAVTRAKTGAKKFDDFTNEKVLEKMSLSDQKKVQDLAVDQAVKQIESKYGNNLGDLTNLIKDKGFGEQNENIQKMLKSGEGIETKELKSLVKELMTVTQGGSGDSEMNKLLGDVTKDTAKSTKDANKNLDKVSKGMDDMAKKLDGFADTVNKAVKDLNKRTNQLEASMSRF